MSVELSLLPIEQRTLFKLTVFGHAEPAGSKRALPMGGKFGGRSIVVDANKKAKPWKDQIAQYAGLAMNGNGLIRDIPIEAEFWIYRKRPQGHFGAKGLKASADKFPMTKPDVLKLARAIEDALTGIVYQDDALIVTEILKKRFGTPERVEIILRDATDAND